MNKKNWIRGTMSVMCVCFATSLGLTADDPDTIKQKQADLKVQIVKQAEQMTDFRTAIVKSADLSAERKARDEAKAALEATVSADSKVQAARKAADEAVAKVKSVEEAQWKESPEVNAAEKEEASAHDSLKALYAQELALHKSLETARHAVTHNPKIVKLDTDVKVAELELKNAPGYSEEVYKATRALEAAKRTLEEKIKTLPEQKAVNDAEVALAEATRSAKEVAGAKSAREAAVTAYNEAFKATAATDPGVVAEQKKIDALETKINEQAAVVSSAHQKAEDARTGAGKKTPKVIEAQMAAQELSLKAKKAADEVRGTNTTALEKAEKELAAKVDSKLAADPKATALAKQLDELKIQSKALQSDAPKPAPRAATTKPAAPTTKATK